MLILTGRAGVTGAVGTTIQIGDDVWIRILAVRNGQVKIGIIVQTILQDLAGPETLVYFQVYERNKSGIVERTRDGYQQNKPLDA